MVFGSGARTERKETAVIDLLYKIKVERTEHRNYRGISLLGVKWLRD